MWAECCDDGGLKFTVRKKKIKELTYEEALEHICNTCDNKSCPYIHYEKSRCVWYGIIKEAIEKAKKYDELNKQ